MNSSPPKIGARASLLSGTAWMVGARWATRCVGLVSTIILARLLAPEDFGLIAMAMLASVLLENLAYAGVDLALMRQDADSREHFDTAWTIQVIQGAFVALMLLLAAPVIAAYFAEPRVVAVVQFIALRAMIDSTQNIGIVKFRKELDFAREFRFILINKVANFVVIVLAAYWFRNYWALVIGINTGSIIFVAVSYLMHPYRPRFSMARASEIWSFSQWLMIARTGSFLNQKADEFIVGGMTGTAAMGNYHLASDLATMPSTEVVMPMRRALFPSLAKLADQPDYFTVMVRDSFSAVAALCLSVGFGLMAVAPEVVHVILGPKWLEAVPLIQWLALYGAFSGLTMLLEVPLWVRGKTKLAAFQAWLELAILVPLVWLAVQAFGVQGAAMARVSVAVAMVPVMMYITARSGGASFAQLAGSIWRPLSAAVMMAWLLSSLALPDAMPAILILAFKVLAGALLYPGILGLLWMLAGRPAGFEATMSGQLSRLFVRVR